MYEKRVRQQDKIDEENEKLVLRIVNRRSDLAALNKSSSQSKYSSKKKMSESLQLSRLVQIERKLPKLVQIVN
jgi:hypothetical protein